MRLPNASLALIDRTKITEYLLQPTHRRGASKARFFSSFGFRRDAWHVFEVALRVHAQTGRVTAVIPTEFGVRYRVDGELETPCGARPRVRTIWQFETGSMVPRLITAYPLEKS